MERFIIKKNFFLPEVKVENSPVELSLTPEQRESLIADGTIEAMPVNATPGASSTPPASTPADAGQPDPGQQA